MYFFEKTIEKISNILLGIRYSTNIQILLELEQFFRNSSKFNFLNFVPKTGSFLRFLPNFAQRAYNFLI